MTLDCTNLKPGDKVRLRNGYTDTVQHNGHDSVPIKLEKKRACHYPDGRWLEGRIHDFDIVEILTNPQPEMDTTTFPFPWKYRLGTLELSDFTWREPAKITINGKKYAPAKDSNLSYPLLHRLTFTVSPITNEVVAITCNGKRFTPADSWPEPITDRSPTLEDANEVGGVQVLDSDGDWMRCPWDDISKPSLGWARTSDWKPRPIDKKTLTLRDLREALRDGKSPDHDTLQSAIELLEATL